MQLLQYYVEGFLHLNQEWLKGPHWGPKPSRGPKVWRHFQMLESENDPKLTDPGLNPLFKLRSHDMTCENLTSDDKAYLGKLIVSHQETATTLHDKTHLSTSVLNKYRRRVENGENIHTSGRPNNLSTSHRKELLDWSRKKLDAGEAATKIEFAEKYLTLKKDTSKERGHLDLSTSVPKTTLKRVINGEEFQTVSGQKKTNARKVAERDPRMAVSMVALCNTAKDIVSELKMNFDATLVDIVENEKGRMLVVPRDRDHNLPVEGAKYNDMAFFVKMFHINNAAGRTWKPVFLVAHSKLPPDALVWTEVPGLTGVNSGDGVGVLAFTRDRSGNKAFFRRYFEEIVIEFVYMLRRLYKLIVSIASKCPVELFTKQIFKDDDGDPIPAWVTCDGEPLQFEASMEEQLSQLLDLAFIMVYIILDSRS